MTYVPVIYDFGRLELLFRRENFHENPQRRGGRKWIASNGREEESCRVDHYGCSLRPRIMAISERIGFLPCYITGHVWHQCKSHITYCYGACSSSVSNRACRSVWLENVLDRVINEIISQLVMIHNPICVHLHASRPETTSRCAAPQHWVQCFSCNIANIDALAVVGICELTRYSIDVTTSTSETLINGSRLQFFDGWTSVSLAFELRSLSS